MRPTRWLSVLVAASLLAGGTIAVSGASSAQAATTELTVTSPVEGGTVSGTTLTVEGTFANTSNLELVVGAQEVIPIPVTGTAGTWTLDIDISDVDGRLDLAVRAFDLTTLYTTWSEFVVVEVDNPAASRPVVTIVSPTEGAYAKNSLKVVVDVASERAISTVEVRVNGGEWKRANPYRKDEYKASFRTSAPEFASIEARATDSSGHVASAPTTYVALGGATAEAPVIYDQDRSMWIWERASYEAVFNEDARDRLGAVMDDTETFNSDPIRTIYLGVDKYDSVDMLRDSRDEVAAFVTWARERGYNVQATVAGGTRPPYLGALEQFEHFAVDEFEKVLNYNLAVPEEARFDGINVDIEPYILNEWKEEDSGGLPNRWLEVLETLMERRDASGLPVLVGPAIPRWLDSSTCCTSITWNGETKPLSDHI